MISEFISHANVMAAVGSEGHSQFQMESLRPTDFSAIVRTSDEKMVTLTGSPHWHTLYTLLIDCLFEKELMIWLPNSDMDWAVAASDLASL